MGINWPTGFNVCPFNPSVPYNLCLILLSCSLSYYKRPWIQNVNFAVHPEPQNLWRHNNLIYTRNKRSRLRQQLLIFFKPEVTKTSGSQATLHTRVQIATATTCGERFWQTFGTWCGCHFIARGHEFPHMVRLEYIDLGTWYELFKMK